MAVSPSPNDLTRQQLDELDALLQRMLSLPISQPEPAVAFPPPPPLPDLPPVPTRTSAKSVPADQPAANWRTDTPTAAKIPHLTPAPEPAAAFHPPAVPFPPAPPRGTPTPSAPPAPRLFNPPPEAPAPTVAPGTLRGVDAPALPLDFQRAQEAPVYQPIEHEFDIPEVNPFADPPPLPLPPAADPAPRMVPLPLWPLFALNWVLELVLGWFGPVGQLLVRPAMKTVLGLAGVLLLLAAGAWAARGMGWVSWPR